MQFTVKIDGKAYDCEVEERPGQKPSRAERGRISSPVAGTVLGVWKRQGEKVKKGELIMTIETPRLETEIRAPRDGRLVMTAAEGESVEASDFLAMLAER